MANVIGAVDRLFSFIFMPLEGARPELALMAVSVVSGLGMFFLYRKTSNQPALKKVQAVIKARILEIQLYRMDLYVMLRALLRVFARNLLYMRLLAGPAAVLIALVAVIVWQCYARFEYRPVRPGESFVVKASLKGARPVTLDAVTLDIPEGLSMEAGPLFVPSLGEVGWRLKAGSPGEYAVTVKAKGEAAAGRVVVGDRLVGVSDPLEGLLPGGPRIGVVATYPLRAMDSPMLLGMDWLVYFFVVSFVAALAAKLVFKTY